MKLFIKCSNCKSEISFWTWCQDRVALKMLKGERIDLTCKKCQKTIAYAVDDFKAIDSKLAIFIALVIFILGAPTLIFLLWDYLWQPGFYISKAVIITSIIAIPGLIFGIINKQDSQRVSRFNRS